MATRDQIEIASRRSRPPKKKNEPTALTDQVIVPASTTAIPMTPDQAIDRVRKWINYLGRDDGDRALLAAMLFGD